MNPLSAFDRDLKNALHQSRLDADLHALEQQMQQLGQQATTWHNAEISMRFLAMDYFVLDQTQSIGNSLTGLMRRLCGREVTLDARPGESATNRKEILGIWASVLEAALDLSGPSDALNSPSRPASPEDVFVTPPSSPQRREVLPLPSPLRRPTRPLPRSVSDSMVPPSPGRLRNYILRRDGLFYDRAVAAQWAHQDSMSLDCGIWPDVAPELWVQFAASMPSLALHLQPDLLPTLARTWFTGVQSGQALSIQSLLALAGQFNASAPRQPNGPSNPDRSSELCHALLRAGAEVVLATGGEPTRRLIWGALLAHDIGPFSAARADAYVAGVLRFARADVAHVSAVAALALAASEQPVPRRLSPALFCHIDALAKHVSHAGQTDVGVRELAQVASSLMAVPEDDLGAMCMCLNRLWPNLAGSAQIWSQARLIGPLTAIDSDLRAVVTRLIVSEQACPTLPRQLDLLMDWLLEIVSEIQFEPTLLEQSIKLMQRAQTSIALERLYRTLSALKKVPRGSRRDLCNVLLNLIGDQCTKFPHLCLHTLIDTLQGLSPADWQLLRDERGAFIAHAGMECVHALSCPQLVKDFVEKIRANGDYASTPIATNTHHHVPAPRETTEVALRREQLQRDMQKLAEVVPQGVRPPPAAAMRSWIRYLESRSGEESLGLAKCADALWAIRTMEKRSSIPATSVLSIAELCSILLYIIENHRKDDGEDGSKARKNMRHSVIARLADCVETKDRERQLICSNGQGQQLVSVLHGYGFNLPSDENITRLYPKEFMCHLGSEFGARLQRMQLEEPTDDQVRQFCLDARRRADEEFGSGSDDWKVFIKELADFLAAEKWGKLPWASSDIGV